MIRRRLPILAAGSTLVLSACGLLSFSQAPAPVAGERTDARVRAGARG